MSVQASEVSSCEAEKPEANLQHAIDPPLLDVGVVVFFPRGGFDKHYINNSDTCSSVIVSKRKKTQPWLSSFFFSFLRFFLFFFFSSFHTFYVQKPFRVGWL